MGNRIVYTAVRSRLKKLFKAEEIILPRFFLTNFLQLMSKLCGYEEEETKIRPQLVLSSGISNALKQVPGHYKMQAKVGKRNGSDLDKIMKSLLPFCNNGWFVYMDIQETQIEYGLLRAFSGPQGLSVTDVLFNTEGLSHEVLEFSLVEICTLNGFEIKVKGLLGSDFVIDFKLINEPDIYCDYSYMASDISLGIEDQGNRESLVKVFSNLLKAMSQKIHGTICIVVQDDYKFPNEYLSDGLWLEDPIDISEKALALIDTKQSNVGEMFYGLSGLLLQMMNVDGITIIDNKGRVRGFNVFINQAKVKAIKSSGGARKRAALALLENNDQGVLGVFFQSQDGNSFYKRRH